MLDTKALAQATALIVREHVDAALSPLLQRIDALEQRQLQRGEKGEAGEPGRDGKDADMAEIKAFALSMVNTVMDEVLPAALAGALAGLPPAEKGEKGDPGDPGRDGNDADAAVIKALARSAVEELLPPAISAAVAAIPPAQKGEKGDPGEPGKDGERGDRGADGQAGIGLAGMMIDRDGEAIATLTDGKMIKLGPVVGRDGKDGAPGNDGRDGRDGRNIDDILVTQDGAVIEFAFQQGEVRSIFEVELPQGPAGADGKDAYPGEAKGLFDPTATYRALDVVSFNGSEWRAKRDHPGDLPGEGWMLSACKGKRGDRGERGPSGPSGSSIVAAYVDKDSLDLVLTREDGSELKASLHDLADSVRITA